MLDDGLPRREEQVPDCGRVQVRGQAGVGAEHPSLPRYQTRASHRTPPRTRDVEEVPVEAKVVLADHVSGGQGYWRIGCSPVLNEPAGVDPSAELTRHNESCNLVSNRSANRRRKVPMALVWSQEGPGEVVCSDVSWRTTLVTIAAQSAQFLQPCRSRKTHAQGYAEEVNLA